MHGSHVRQDTIFRDHRPCRPPPRPRQTSVACLACALLSALALAASPARAQDIRTVITPEATTMRWDNNLGLENKALYGGRIDLEFDRWIALEGYFHTNNGVQTLADKLGASAADAARLGDQRLRLRSYGANVKLQLAAGDIVPYIDLGGGVLEFRPETGDRSRQVALNAGGGLRLKLFDPLRLDLFARDAMFRINRYALFAPTAGGTLPQDPNADKLRHNLVLGAGLGIPFGPTSTEANGPIGRTPWGVNGLSFALEPVAGQLKFDSPNLADQTLAGIRAGVDIGPLVGLRGFYWRGVSDNFSNTNPVQSWSGEAQFRLNSGTGIAPFVLVGGGTIDFKSSFRNEANQPVRDRTSFIAGGGLSVPLGERLALNLTARDYMFGEQSNLTDVASADNLTHNWMWSAGLRFSVGGKRGSEMVRERQLRDARMRERLEASRDRRDSLERELALERMAQRDSAEGRMARQTPVARSRNQTGSGDKATPPAPRATGYVSGRVVNIPVPAQGELYVRYGPATDSQPPMPNVSGRGPASRTRGADSLDMRREDMRTGRDRMAERDAGRQESGTVSRAEMREMIRDAIHSAQVDARLDALHDELARDRMDALHDDMTQGQIDAMQQQRLQAQRETPAAAGRSLSTRRPLTSSGGEVAIEPRTRVPVTKNRAVTSPSLTRDDLRALVDSVRREQRAQGDSTARSTARSDSLLLSRVDSVVNARLESAEAARRAERDSIATAMRDSVRRANAERDSIARDSMARAQSPAQETQNSPSLRAMRTTLYGGANVSDGAQAIAGLRVDLGPVGRDFRAVHFLPELALGWGDGARSTMVAGNLQLALPTLRFGSWPAITPQVEGGVGILNFSQPISGHDGTNGVVNLGYGVGIDLWRRSPSGGGPVLVVEHQGVDLFKLNRILAGLRWAF